MDTHFSADLDFPHIQGAGRCAIQIRRRFAQVGKASPSASRARRPEVGVVLLPLRLFPGISLAWAGLAKLADPHFFSPELPVIDPRPARPERPQQPELLY